MAKKGIFLKEEVGFKAETATVKKATKTKTTKKTENKK